MTIEAMLWLPLFLAVAALILDTTMIFSGNANVYRVTQDANRHFVKGAIFGGDTAVMETWIEDMLQNVAPNAVASATVDANGRLTTIVTYPSSDTDVTGFINAFPVMTMRVVVIYQTEA